MNEIEYRFPKSTCNAFLREYMSDDQPAEEVEKRGKQLQQIIEHHALAANPPKTLTTMEDVSRWYVEETGQIEQLPVDEELREFHRVQLNMRYAELTQSLLETMHP